MKQEETRERAERQRKAAGERELKQMIMASVQVVVTDTVKCVSIIIHPCSVWPAR